MSKGFTDGIDSRGELDQLGKFAGAGRKPNLSFPEMYHLWYVSNMTSVVQQGYISRLQDSDTSYGNATFKSESVV